MPEIALHILDLVQNCITALATQIRILLTVSIARNVLSVEIADNGKGMSEEFLKKVVSPFATTRTTRRVGLGIPLLKAGCEAAGGSFKICSALGKGTSIYGAYQLDHIDRPPLGDFAGTVHSLIVCNSQIDFYIEANSDQGSFHLDTAEIREQLGSVPFTQPEVSIWLKEYLDEGMAEAKISAL